MMLLSMPPDRQTQIRRPENCAARRENHSSSALRMCRATSLTTSACSCAAKRRGSARRDKPVTEPSRIELDDVAGRHRVDGLKWNLPCATRSIR